MKIRRMTEDDLEFAVHCVRIEGWSSETEQSFRSFLEVDPGGCSIAEVDDTYVGLCVAVSYGESGFLGELIVLEEFRGRGFGRKLMEHSMDYLRGLGCRSICLDGVDPATDLYEKLGFKHVCKSLRFVGKIFGATSPGVRPMVSDDLEEIAALDAEAFHADRSRYLRRRFDIFPELCRVLTLENRVAGYIMAQPGVGVTSVGPWVVAESVDNPIELVESLATEAADTSLRIGVLESNIRAVQVLRSAGGLEEKSPSYRMVLGEDTRLGTSDQLFAIGSPAKG